jgi:hypothetical protein
MTAVLDLVRGLPNYFYVGKAAPYERKEEAIDLLNGVLRVADENGDSSWSPKPPSLKGGGVWIDSPLANGRQLLNAPLENVTETIVLTVATDEDEARNRAIQQLQSFALAAQNFFTSGGYVQPVYIRLKPHGIKFRQYALIYNLEIDVDMDVLKKDEAGTITLTIEREPLWRALAPGENPKLYQFIEVAGRYPQSDGSAGAIANGKYNAYSLSLMTSLTVTPEAGVARSFATGVKSPFDEIKGISSDGTEQNYISIPASSIPGDAPALALISLQNTSAVSLRRLILARSTGYDFFPTVTTNNSGYARQRLTFNLADATLGGAVIVTKINDNTIGLIGNGSTTQRYYVRIDYTAAPGPNFGTVIGSWTRAICQYMGRYAVLMRARIPGSVNAQNVVFMLRTEVGASGSLINFQQTQPMRIAQGSFGLTYLGLLDMTAYSQFAITPTGTGIDTLSTFTLTLIAQKLLDSTVYSVEMWDLILIPIDEPNAVVNSLSNAAFAQNDFIFLDSTGYFGRAKEMEAAVNFNAASVITSYREFRGAGIELIPDTENRILLIPDYVSPAPTVRNNIRVDIVPRFTGARTE